MFKLQGWAEQGAQQVQTAGQLSTSLVQGSFPGATITVYIAGTGVLASIFGDNSGTPKSNPFQANNAGPLSGYWFFYAGNGRYDVQISGAGLASPFTLSDILLFDPSTGIVNQLTLNLNAPTTNILYPAPTANGLILTVQIVQGAGGQGVSWGPTFANRTSTPPGPTPPTNVNPDPGAPSNLTFEGIGGLWSLVSVVM